MRVLLSSMRMMGHLRPLLPYAAALLDRGHEVVVAAPESAAVVLRDAGLEHAVFGHPGDRQLGEIWASTADLPDEQKIDIFVGRIFADLNARAALPGLLEAIRTWQPDLILRESAEFGSAIAAALANIPFVSVATSNRLSEITVIERALGSLDAIRRDVGLDPDNGASLRAAPAFTSFPPSLDGDVATAGATPFRVRTTREAVPSDRVVPAWARDDGRPLVFITFGTLAASSAKNHKLFRAAIDSVAALPVRALMSTGAEVDPGMLGAVPANVTVEPWVRPNEVFPRASVLVCHGGSGTLLAGLAHGLPMVVVPLTADQPENARRVDAAGAGITVVRHEATILSAAIERTLVDARMREAAARLAREMAALATMDDAVAELERLNPN